MSRFSSRFALFMGLMLFLGSTISGVFVVQRVEASGTIYIRTDGSVDPPAAPISTVDNVTYILTGNIDDSIVVERDNITIDGAGYTLQRTGFRTGVGIELTERRNVKVTNVTIQNFDFGINSSLNSSSYSISNISIVGNNIIDSREGVNLEFSSNNSITGNVFTDGGLLAYNSYGNLVEANLVNGKPLVYLEGVSNHVVEDAGQVILLNCNNMRIENLNLSKTNYAIQLGGTNNTIIKNNQIIAKDHVETGILLYASSNNNSIAGNNITNNSYGMWLETFSNNNSIVGNNIAYNSNGILLGGGSLNNHIFHNNFMNNTQQTVAADQYSQFWDDGYPSGGNYWSDYTGVDSNHDGIGDTVHVLDGNNTDRYPLMGMFSEFNVSLPYDKTENVTVISNSTVSNLSLLIWLSSPYEGLQPGQPFIQFSATGENGSVGFCRLMIPRTVLNSSSYIVLVDSYPVNAIELPVSNSTHVYLYFTYAHSTHEVIVTIPEFASCLVLSLFIMATLLAVALYKRNKQLFKGQRLAKLQKEKKGT
jgi:nitrous oxidase accessory protein NosD